MKLKALVAALLVIPFVSTPLAVEESRQPITVSGTAKKEAKRPYYSSYYVRARMLTDGSIGMAVPLDSDANFVLADMQPGEYLLELLNPQGKVVCTEGPLTFTKNTNRVQINCGRDRTPVFWLLTAAAASGITAGIAAGGPASPSR